MPQLEAFVIARGQMIESLQREMSEIQMVIAAKNRHWLEVERFEGMSAEEVSRFKSLHQGVAFSEVKSFA